MVSLVQGPSRDQETCDKLVEDFAERTNRVPPGLVTTDEHAPYKGSLLKTYGVDCTPEPTSKTGRKSKPKKRGPTSAASRPTIATTTNSSSSVKPRARLQVEECNGLRVMVCGRFLPVWFGWRLACRLALQRGQQLGWQT